VKYLILFITTLLLAPVYGQICQDVESDTFYVIEARASVRFNLNDAGSSTHWPDSVINDWLNQSCYEIAGNKTNEKRDTIVTSDSVGFHWMNYDFMSLRGLLIKGDSRWSNLLIPDSLGRINGIVKQDTITTTNNTMMYELNDDFGSLVGAIIKRKSDRWVTLKPASLIGDGSFGDGSDLKNINSYTIVNNHLLLDTPPVEGGETIIVIYVAYQYFVSDKRLANPSLSDGDSIIVVYYAFANNLSGDSVIVNIPYQYRTQLIEGAVKRALRAIGQ